MAEERQSEASERSDENEEAAVRKPKLSQGASVMRLALLAVAVGFLVSMVFSVGHLSTQANQTPAPNSARSSKAGKMTLEPTSEITASTEEVMTPAGPDEENCTVHTLPRRKTTQTRQKRKVKKKKRARMAASKENMTMKAPTTTKTTMTPMWKKPLLCSFEATLSPSLVFPEDGLCDISFFQALEQNRTFLKGKGSEYDAALNAFQMNAAKQKKTEHGISLDSKYNVAAMKILKEPIAKKTIKELWGKKIYHWAYLNAEVDDLTAENITRLFEILRDIKWTIDKTIKPRRPHYVIYTGSLDSADKMHIETNAIENIMWLDGMGAYTHFIDDDRSWAEGRIMPPSFWMRPDSNDTAAYSYSMATAHKNLRKIAHQELNHTALYFTATMAARRYIPEKTYAYLAPMQPSVEELFVDIMAYCKNSKYTYGFQAKDVVGSFYVSDEEKKFISFDDSKALGMKFCKGKKDLTDVNYGFIAYNVEMDDPTNKCGKGAYHRVKFLRRLAEFFRDNFTTPDNVNECMNLT